MKILFIEDDNTHISFFSDALKKDGHTIKIASYHREFITYLNKDIHSYDIILCDHYYPIFDKETTIYENGIEALLELLYINYQGTFIHFSTSPCEDRYNFRKDFDTKIKFKSLQKRKDIATINKLLEYINSN
jgi:hypothetical protein